MIRSMYSGISGMKNFQTKLDVIGNNISNVNTYGFKKGRTIFKDLISQTTSGASAPTDTRGGVNAKQVGLGSQLAAIDTIHTGGAMQSTGNTLDIAISGDGFFQVADATNGQNGFTNTQYTRAGNFYMDRDGYLVDSSGKYLVGTAGTVTQTQVMEYKIGQVDATGQSPILDDAGAPTNYSIDSTGKVFDINDLTSPIEITIGTVPDDETGNLKLDSSTGKLSFVVGTKSYPIEGNNPYTVKINNVVIDATTEVEDIFDLRLPVPGEFTDTYSPSNQLRPIIIPTDAQSMSVGQDGTVQFVDKNGELQWAGQLQLAKFPNPGGLQKVGSNYFQETANSGQPLLANATESGIGSVNSGFLEMSNVDLSEEFTDMIVAQRGFQANTRIITTSDSILEELINLKR